MKETQAKIVPQPVEQPDVATAPVPIKSFNSANSMKSYERSMLKYRF